MTRLIKLAMLISAMNVFEVYSQQVFNDSINTTIETETFVSYHYLGGALGIVLNEQKDISSKIFYNSTSNYFINIFYSHVSFKDSIQYRETQIGLYNELGLQNATLYYKFGPILQLWNNYFLIPNAGVGFALSPGVENSGVAFLYYAGITSGGEIKITPNISANVQVGTIYIPLLTTYTYLKVGVSLNLE